jgi:hypothetical protein
MKNIAQDEHRPSFPKPQKPMAVRVWAGLAASVLALGLAGCDETTFKSADSLQSQARQALDAKNYSIAAERAAQWSQKSPNDYAAHYLLAQARALLGDRNGALMALEQAIKSGLRDDVEIDANPNLAGIRDMSAYSDLMNASFPSRSRSVAGVQVQLPGAVGGVRAEAGAQVSIHESNGKTVVRADDLVVEVPKSR